MQSLGMSFASSQILVLPYLSLSSLEAGTMSYPSLYPQDLPRTKHG